MLALRMVSNVEDIIGALTDMEFKHVPFALSKALNETAKEGRAEVARQLPNRFTLRNAWVTKGVRAKFSTKKNLEALVFTKDWFMETQEQGGTRTARSAPNLFVPSLNVRQGQSLSGRVVGKRPKTLLRDMKRADERRAQRLGKKRRAGKKKAADSVYRHHEIGKTRPVHSTRR